MSDAGRRAASWAAEHLGVALPPETILRLGSYVTALLDENLRINLTATREPDAFWREHVCDAIALLPLIDAAQASRLLDLGSGGGLPGVPIACAREGIRVTLLDATRKKIDALRRVLAAVRLPNVECIAARAESAAHDPAQREAFDVVTARAVASLPVLVEYAAGFVRVGGCILFPKSTDGASREIAPSADAARACGLLYDRTIAYELPDAGPRAIVRYRKVSPTPRSLPRGTGQASKRPLGGIG